MNRPADNPNQPRNESIGVPAVWEPRVFPKVPAGGEIWGIDGPENPVLWRLGPVIGGHVAAPALLLHEGDACGGGGPGAADQAGHGNQREHVGQSLEERPERLGEGLEPEREPRGEAKEER